MQLRNGSACHPLASITACSSDIDSSSSIPVFWALVGDFLRPQFLRHHPRQHEFILHQGCHPGPFRRWRDLRSHRKLRPRIHGNHDSATDLHRDDRALDQAMGETRNVRSDAYPLKPLPRLIRLLCQTPNIYQAPLALTFVNNSRIKPDTTLRYIQEVQF
jgi:hypothetical protein